MVNHKRLYFSGFKFFQSRARLSPIICFCLVLVMLAACGDATSTATPQPSLAPTAAPTTASLISPNPTTAVATTAPAPTPTLGNPVGGSTPASNGGVSATVPAGAVTPGGTALPGIPDEIKKPFALISTDLQKRSNLPAASFQVTGYTLETFPDSALGCPDPNMMYTQVLTPGYSIQVTAGGRSYDYRTNLAGTHMVLCGSNGRPTPVPTP